MEYCVTFTHECKLYLSCIFAFSAAYVHNERNLLQWIQLTILRNTCDHQYNLAVFAECSEISSQQSVCVTWCHARGVQLAPQYKKPNYKNTTRYQMCSCTKIPVLQFACRLLKLSDLCIWKYSLYHVTIIIKDGVKSSFIHAGSKCTRLLWCP
jgi:hypothetical protein